MKAPPAVDQELWSAWSCAASSRQCVRDNESPTLEEQLIRREAVLMVWGYKLASDRRKTIFAST